MWKSRHSSSRVRRHRSLPCRRELGDIEILESRRLLAADAGQISALQYAAAAPTGQSRAAPLAAADPMSALTVAWGGRRLHAVPGEFVFRSVGQAVPAVPQGWGIRSIGEGTWVLSASGASETQVRSWSAKAGCTDLEPNYIFRPLATPVDPQYPNQWHLPKINAPSAWNTTTGSGKVIVAVLDTGIDCTNPDFSTAGTQDHLNIWQNLAEKNGKPGVDDDNNGYVDDWVGVDAGNPIQGVPIGISSFSQNAGSRHGTAVAGVIGAVAGSASPQNNVAGVSWTVSLMDLKITRTFFIDDNAVDVPVLDAAVLAYRYIQKMRTSQNLPITVANCSWGTYEDNVSVRNLEKEILKAGGQNVLTVAAAGDAGVDIDTTPFYPAAFQNPYVLSVAATDENDVLVSNYGVRNVDVAAPGTNIITVNGTYSGTSMAAGVVSGLAALMKSANPTAPALAIKQVIIDTVSVRGYPILSQGIIDADRAIALIQEPTTPSIDILHAPGQDSGVLEGDVGFTAAAWQIRVRGPLLDPRPLYVQYRTLGFPMLGGSATPDGRYDPSTVTDPTKKPDYIPVQGTMVFMPGGRVLDWRLRQAGVNFDVGRTKLVPVRIFGDRNVEPNETITLQIDRAFYRDSVGQQQDASQYIITRTNDFTIINDDTGAPNGSNPDARTPQISFVGNGGGGGQAFASSVEVREGDAGTTVARFPLKLSIPTTNTVTVRYRTRDLDGRAGFDYVQKTGMVTFAPNVTQQYIDVAVMGNRTPQPNRSFQVELFDPTNAVLPGAGQDAAGAVATGIILDDEPMILPLLAQFGDPQGTATATRTSRFLTITLTLSQPVTSQVTVRYVTQDLTAIAGRNYVASRGVAVFAPNTSSTTINIPLINSSFPGYPKDFLVLLSQATNAGLGVGRVRCTIT